MIGSGMFDPLTFFVLEFLLLYFEQLLPFALHPLICKSQPPLQSSVAAKIGIPSTVADPNQLNFYVFLDELGSNSPQETLVHEMTNIALYPRTQTSNPSTHFPS
jgi:hypothetical protein